MFPMCGMKSVQSLLFLTARLFLLIVVALAHTSLLLALVRLIEDDPHHVQ